MADRKGNSRSANKPKKRKDPDSQDGEKATKRLKIDLSSVKNKLKRQELFKTVKYEKNKEKRERRKKQKKDVDWEKVGLFKFTSAIANCNC